MARAQTVAIVDRRVDPALIEHDRALRARDGFPLGFTDLRKSQLPGIGGPSHQEVDDLHVVVEPEAEARVMLLVEGLEQPGDLALGERIDVDR